MTCRQMGGPCDASLYGNTADEMIKNGATHIDEQSAKGDEAHKKVKIMMDAMKKNPASGMDWYTKFQKDFSALKES